MIRSKTINPYSCVGLYGFIVGNDMFICVYCHHSKGILQFHIMLVGNTNRTL